MSRSNYKLALSDKAKEDFEDKNPRLEDRNYINYLRDRMDEIRRGD